MRCFLLTVGLLGALAQTAAQSLSVNTTGAAAHNSSILDVTSTSKGVLIPRMTKAQKNAIATPAAGLLVYQAAPDSVGFHFYNGTQWIWLKPDFDNDWKLTGNTGTDTAVNFIGTTDNMPLAFRVNNEKAGRIESSPTTANTFIGNRSGASATIAAHNTGIGFRSLTSLTAGNSNVAIGTRSLTAVTTGNNNVAIGDSAAFNSNVSGIVAVGSKALYSNTTGLQNTAVGYHSLHDNTTGNNNSAFGNQALSNNTTGLTNSAFGSFALQQNTTGSSNSAFGFGALINNTTGTYNHAFGYGALNNNTTGSFNSAFGDALGRNTTGSGNVAFGGGSLNSNTVGFANSAVGNATLTANVTGNSNSALGYFSLVGNITGFSNAAVGAFTLYNNISGSNNVAVGDSAAHNSNVSGIVAVGSKALFNNSTGINNVAVGDRALRNNTTGYENTSVGSMAGNANITAYGNTSIGANALQENINGSLNTVVGANALSQSVSSNQNSVLGAEALVNRNAQQTTAIGQYAGWRASTPLNTVINDVFLGWAAGINTLGDSSIFIGGYSGEASTGDQNIMIGQRARGNASGSGTIALGNYAGYNSSGSNKIMLGAYSGTSSSGSGNIFIGNNVGTSIAQSNTLMIDNTATSAPLIFGNFSTDLLRINGTLNINNLYSFPTADGTANQVLRTDGAGNVSWSNAAGNANNGLSFSGTTTQLGGNLLTNTTITQGNFNMNYLLNGTGEFGINDGTTQFLRVKGNGFVGVNTPNPQFRMHITNTFSGDGPFGRGIMIENNNATTGEASIAFRNTGTNGLPNNRAWMAGMNNFPNFVIAYGDSIVGSNVRFKIDTSGNVSINTQGNPGQSKLDVRGSFGNGIEVISANYTATNEDHTIIIAATVGAAALTVTLPAAGTCPRREYVLVNRNASIKTITQYNDFTGTSTSIPASGSITIQSNGSNWFRTR